MGYRSQKFKDITEKMFELYQNKQSDYGDSVAKTYEEWGMVSFLVRMEDKLNRAISITKKHGDIRVADEKLEDTLIDLANYTVMALVELNREKDESKATLQLPTEAMLDIPQK